MKTEMKKVRHKGQVVDEIEVPIYETMDELRAGVADAVVVDLFNKANVIALQATARSPYSEKKVGKQKRQSVGFDLLTTEEIMSFAGNHAGLLAFLDTPDMQQRIDEKLGVTDEDGDDDDDGTVAE